MEDKGQSSTQVELGDGNLTLASSDEPVQHIHSKTVILVVAIVGVYFGHLVHIVGTGFLVRDVTAVVGGADQTVWFTISITICTVVLNPPISQAADLWGRKTFVVVMNMMGSIGCIIVSRSNSIGMAIAGQCIAGLAHGSQGLLHAITSEVIPRKFRPLAQSSNNVAAALGALVALMGGGALVRNDPDGFRNFWYLAAGIYMTAAVTVFILYHPPPRPAETLGTNREKLARLDWMGFFLLCVGLLLLCIGLSWAHDPDQWNSAHVLAPLVSGIFAVMVLIVYEWKFKKDGLFHHGLFSRGGNFVIALFCIFTEGLSFFAANNYFGYQISVLYDVDQFNTGLRNSIIWYAYIIFAILAGIYCSRTKTIRLPTMIAYLSFTIFYVLMATTNLHSANFMWGYGTFLGAGLGIALNALIVTAQLSTPPEFITVATCLMISTRSLGATVGLAIYGAIYENTIQGKMGPSIAKAVLPLGFPKGSLGNLIASLLQNNENGLKQIPGATGNVISAAEFAIKTVRLTAFRRVWITAAAFTFFACLVTFFLVDPEKEFNSRIDAPVETREELEKV